MRERQAVSHRVEVVDVVVNKKPRISTGILFLSLLIGCAGWPQANDADPSDVEVRLHGFVQNDKDGSRGNPNLKESQSIIQPVIILRGKLAEDLDASLRYAYDRISGDSSEVIQPKAVADARSGASKDIRQSGVLTLAKTFETSTLGLSLGYSEESDYLSRNISMTYKELMFDENTSLTLRLSGFFDELDDIDRFNEKHGVDNRDTRTIALEMTQYLSPQDTLGGGISYTHQYGLLSTPRNFVVVNDVAFDEVLPREKDRYAAFITERHAFSDQYAAEIGYRYYTDDWQLKAHTPEVKWYNYLGSEEYLLRLHYRYHDQKGLKYFSESLSAMPEFATQDYDLGDFHSHAVGVLFSLPLLQYVGMEIGVENTLRSDDISWFFWQLGFQFKQTSEPLIDNLSAYWLIPVVAAAVIVGSGEEGFFDD